MMRDCFASLAMTMRNNRNTPFWLGLALAAGTLFAVLASRAATTAPAVNPPSGQLLVAADTIQDPRFYHSVILLVRHDDKGALGIMINRPLGDQPIADLLADGNGSGDKPAGKNSDKNPALRGTIEVYFGGPVQPQFGFVIHSPDYHSAATMAVTPGIAMTATREVLRAIGQHRGPKKYRFAIGYSGWGAGQLEHEIARRDWFITPATPDLVFDPDAPALWRKAMALRTQEL
jgi:putative transcriptional regulator